MAWGVMELVSVYFDYDKPEYERLMKVFEYSIKKHTGLDLQVIKLDPPPPNRTRSLDANTLKLNKWVEYLEEKEEGAKVVFLDCDMLCIKDFSDAFDIEFDVCYTHRRTRVPFNGGVVFVRNNKYSRDFFRQWAEVNEKMHKDAEFHKPWHSKYAGINQSAFGYLLEKGDVDCHIEALPCSIYNVCDEDWKKIHKDARLIHYKSELRRAVLGIQFMPYLEPLVYKWLDYARNVGIDIYQ
jgi:hypothetical protein